jgi:transcriptional regulator with XRE-family HTH domain
MTTMAIRLRLHEVRESHGLTQAELAERAGVSRATVNRYENAGVGGVDFETLEKLADALDVNAVSLLVHERGKR